MSDYLCKFEVNGIINDIYDFVEFIDRGSRSSVYKVRNKTSSVIYAAKDFDVEAFDQGENFYDEITCLLQLKHENVIKLVSVVVSSNKRNVYMILEYCQSNLADIIENDKAPKEKEIKTLMFMLFSGLSYLHDKRIIHRDINPTNLLLLSGILKIADFGSAVICTEKEISLDPNIGTRWYRAPELLFGSSSYTTSVDVWAAACVFGELLIRKPLFPGNCDTEQICLIVDFLGVPNDELMPGFSSYPLARDFNFIRTKINDLYNTAFQNVCSEGAICLLKKLLMYNCIERLNALNFLSSSYFEEDPLPESPVNTLCIKV